MSNETNASEAGETNLSALIAGMEPVMHEETFVFSTMNGQSVREFVNRVGKHAVTPVMTFKEQEGLTWIVSRAEAERYELSYEFPCRMITLNIHSALAAVGFLARVTTRLAALGMGVNPVAGFYHDHLFIPEDRAQDALQELQKMVEEQRAISPSSG